MVFRIHEGVLFDSTGWLPVTVANPELISTMTLYGTEEGWEVPKRKSLSLDEHKALGEGGAPRAGPEPEEGRSETNHVPAGLATQISCSPRAWIGINARLQHPRPFPSMA
jgi:hypothetical protein